MFTNDLPSGRDTNYIVVNVDSSPDGKATVLGAVLTLHVGDHIYKRVVGATGASFDQGLDTYLHVGLGAADTIDKASVRWTNGEELTLEIDAVNQIVEAGSHEEPVARESPDDEISDQPIDVTGEESGDNSDESAKAGSARGVSKDAFVKAQRERYESKGWAWDAAKVEAMFNEMDADGNGSVNRAERNAYWEKKRNRQEIPMKFLIPICLLFAHLPVHAAETARPNVVIFMADDIGLGDVGFYHRQRTGNAPIVPTPNIDRLIEEGMRFSDAHSPASLCAPSRFSMLTGNYPERSGSIYGVWRLLTTWWQPWLHWRISQSTARSLSTRLTCCRS